MTYNVTVNSGGNGSCYGSTTYVYSSSSQTKGLTYSPNSGYTFSYWSVSGGSASASGTILTINANSRGNITVTGYFTWYAVSITLTNPNSRLVFRSISGTLYTNSACTSTASTNTKYTGTTFYYKSTDSKPSGSYIYYQGRGYATESTTSKMVINSYILDGSLDACMGDITTQPQIWSNTEYSSGSGSYYYWTLGSSFGWRKYQSYGTKYIVAPSSF